MSNIQMFNTAALPAAFAQAGREANKELAAGIDAGYAVLSFRGKIWRVKMRGQEFDLMRTLPDGSKEPRMSLDVVLIAAASVKSKIFYKDGWQEGSTERPDCWSTDGIRPDAQVPNKQHDLCAACPQNAWGSKLNQATGKQGKACADAKRVAVLPAGDTDTGLADAMQMFGGPLLLRVPAASLQELMAYAGTLDRHGVPFFAVVTRISFDSREAYPKLTFEPKRMLTEAEAPLILEQRDSDVVDRILSDFIEYESAPAAADPAVAALGAVPAALQVQQGQTPQGQTAQPQRQRRARNTVVTSGGNPVEVNPAPTPEAKPVQAAPAPVPVVDHPAPPPGFQWQFDANGAIAGLIPASAAQPAPQATVAQFPGATPAQALQAAEAEEAQFTEVANDGGAPASFTDKLKALGFS